VGIRNGTSAPTSWDFKHPKDTPAGTVWLRMTDERRKRFKELCEIAEVESDPELLSDLACEIWEIILDEANDGTKCNDRPV
jgi:hypothetical protein